MQFRTFVLGAALSVSFAAMFSGCAEEANPLYCTGPDQCDDGLTCNTTLSTCVSLDVALDPTGFVVEEPRWWSTTSGPELHGTHNAATTPVIEAIVGGVVVGEPATIRGGDWTIQLPDGTVSPSGTEITIRLNASGDLSAIAQTFAFDNVVPTAEVNPELTIVDERGDNVTFNASGPVHAHDGAAIQLATAPGVCSDVYWHPYIHGQTPAEFGSETAENPLQWQFKVRSRGALQQAEYRVLRNLVEATPWTGFTTAGGDAEGEYKLATVDLFPDGTGGIADLATATDTFVIEARFTDWAGREATASGCWVQHPLPAPLQIGNAVLSTGADALNDWTLAANSPVSRILLDGGLGAEVATVTVTQHSAQEQTLRTVIDTSELTYSNFSRNDYILEQANIPGTEYCSCAGCPPIIRPDRCNPNIPNDPADLNVSAADATATWTISAIETTDGVANPMSDCAVNASTSTMECVIPARTTAGQARTYAIKLRAAEVIKLRPPGTATIAEYLLLSKTFTGRKPVVGPPQEGPFQCTNFNDNIVYQGNVWRTCARWDKYQQIQALDHVTLSTDTPIGLRLTSSIAPGAEEFTPLTMTAESVPVSFAWDSGDDDLPGPN